MIAHLAAVHVNRTKVCPTELLFEGQHTELRHAGMSIATHETFSWCEIVEEGAQEKKKIGGWTGSRGIQLAGFNSPYTAKFQGWIRSPRILNCNSKWQPEISLMGKIKWVRICLPMQGTWVRYWSRKIPHAAEPLSLCPTTPEPTLWRPPSHNCWARVLQLLKLVCLEPVLATRDATTVRSPCTATKSSPCSLQLEKACVQPQRPSTAKINE